MGLKVFGPGGIDQKTNDLVRDQGRLRDSRNIQYNTHKEYVKRDGTDVDPDFSGDTYSDMIFIKSLNEYFFRNGLNYNKYSDGVKSNIYRYGEPTSNTESLISHAEELNTLVFTHTEGQNFTAKYDGRAVYRAGLPTQLVTSWPTGTTQFFLGYYEFIDGQGNTYYGPANFKQLNSLTPSLNISSFKDTGFYAGYILMAPAVLPGDVTTIDASNRTITYTSVSPDFFGGTVDSVGTKVPIRSNEDISCESAKIVISDSSDTTQDFGDYTVILEIESITATQITFTAESIGTKVIDIYTFNAPNILGSLKFRVFYSDEETTGYEGNTAQFSPTVSNFNAAHTYPYLSLGNQLLLSDFYDITTSKLRPPKCKYLSMFGNQLVCGSVISFYDFQNKEINYINNDLIMYSDISNGDSAESFSEINRQLIGDTYDGQITGLIRARDSMMVFKDTGVYSLDGILIPGQYGLRKIETNEIGCLSFKSIISMDGVVLFQGQDGIYQLNGYKAEKGSTVLDPFFETIDPYQTRSVVRNKKDQYLFFTDQGFAVFDYHYKEWFIWDSLDASKGLIVNNERDVLMFTEDQAIEFVDFKHDQDEPIDAWVKTSFFDLQEPSLLKKVTDIRFFSLHNQGQVLTSRLYYDWDESKVKADFTVDMSDSSTKTVLTKVDIQQAQSFSFFIGNDIIDEDLNLSGFEIICALIQSRDKNVK